MEPASPTGAEPPFEPGLLNPERLFDPNQPALSQRLDERRPHSRDFGEVQPSHEFRLLARWDDMHASGFGPTGGELCDHAARTASDGHGDTGRFEDSRTNAAGRDLEGLVEEEFGTREVQEELVDRCRLHDGGERFQAVLDLTALPTTRAPRNAHDSCVRAQA